jgi:hypothetical protein
MIEQLHCLECERDFTGTPDEMVFTFTEHDCFRVMVQHKIEQITGVHHGEEHI